MIIHRPTEETGVPAHKIERIVQGASYLYKTYRIPKRAGGFREIHHPTRDLKFLQRWLNRNIFLFLPVHEAAIAYRRGRSIVDSARPHARSNYVLKMDFKNFFPSLKRSDVELVVEQRLMRIVGGVSDQDVEVILNIVCRHNALTIGAPSSPILSNALLYDFDNFVADMCYGKKVVYTRYADDLFFSTNIPNVLRNVREAICNDLRDRESPRLSLNDKKTVFTSRKRKRIITGLVLTSDGQLSIGRAKKRALRTLVHQYIKEELEPAVVSYLRGYLSYVNSVEPEFIARMRIKYGDQAINELMVEELKTRK